MPYQTEGNPQNSSLQTAAEYLVSSPLSICPHCGASPQPLHDELPIPLCCEAAQREAIYGEADRTSPATPIVPPRVA